MTVISLCPELWQVWLLLQVIHSPPPWQREALKRRSAPMTPLDRHPQVLPARIEATPLDPGLYLVSTPIGTARDITLRALDVLNAADVLVAEDTRTLRHLLSIHGIPLQGRRIIAIHDHNEEQQANTVLSLIEAGQSVAYCSEAGTPLVADPGFRLARHCISQGARVHAVPGPSAILAALAVAGLPSDRFLFAGFAPQTKAARRDWLEKLMATDATAIIFESPRRIKQTLEILCEIDPNRLTVVCRELTKKFEEVFRGPASEVMQQIPQAGLRGEVVLLIDRAGAAVVDEGDLESALRGLLDEMSLRDAAAVVAERYGIPKREAYQLGLSIERER